jgi:hypothetical protein
MTPYTTTQLLQTVANLQMTPRFLLDFFFPDTVTFDTEQISFDVEGLNLKLAPFVSPLVAGKAQKGRGFDTKFFKPAYVKPKHQLDPTKPLIRQAGEAFGGTMSAGQRRDMAIAQLLKDQRDQIVRRMEWMAAQVLTTGAVTVVGDDYPSVTVDFGRAGGQTVTLSGGNRWGQSGISPYANIDTWCDTVSSAVGAGVDTVVMGKGAWGFLRQDASFIQALDRTHGQNYAIDLGFQSGMPGAPMFKGSVGDLAFYTYNGTYQSDTDGSTVKLLDDNGVLLAARGANAGLKAFGAILDGSAGYRAIDQFPKMWLENDPPVEFVMTQSAPLVIPRRPNASMYVKVA